MSNYLPKTAVLHELHMQQKRKAYGLTNGTYVKYPSSEAEDHFVVKATKLYGKDGELHQDGILLKERMDAYLAQVVLFRAEQEASRVARGDQNAKE